MYTEIICKAQCSEKYYGKSIFNQIAMSELFQAIVNTIIFDYDSLIVNTWN